MATNPEVKIRLSLDGAGQVQAGANASAESLLKLEKASATLAQAQAGLESASSKAAAAQQALAKATADTTTSAAALADLNQKNNQAAAQLQGATVRAKEAESAWSKLKATTAGAGQQMQLTGNQTAQLSAQLQDFFVQIQGGAAPLTAFIQQSSQLSAVFGGFGNASRAVLSLLSPTVVGVSALAATVGVLALAYYKGSEEARQFNRTLILSGNAAGVTVNRLSEMAAAVKSLGGGTQSRAAEVLNALARSGQIGAESFVRFTDAAIRFEKVGGAAAEETAKAFENLGRSPSEAAAKLNEGVNYLTRSTYGQIRALEEAGRKTEAAKVAQDAYADALQQRTPELLKNLGAIEKAWLGIKDAIKGAGDQVLNVGRPQTDQEKLDALRGQLTGNRLARETAGEFGRMFANSAATDNTALQENIRLLQRGIDLKNEAARAAGEEADKVQAGIKWRDESNKYLSNAARMQQELTRVTEEGAKAGADALEIERRRAVIRQQYDPGVNIEQIRQAERRREEEIKRGINSINALRDQGYIRETTAIEELTRLEIDGIDNRKAALSAELAIVSKRQNSERDVAALRGQIAALDAERETARLKGAQAVTTAVEKQKKAIDALNEAEREQNRQDQEADQRADQLARQQLALAIDAQVRSLREESAQLNLEFQVLGRVRGERELELANLRTKVELEKRLDEINKNLAFNQSQREVERQRARDVADLAKANAAARAQLTEMGDAIQSIDSTAQRVWTDVASGGQDAFKRVGNTIKSAVLDLLYQMTIKKWVISVSANLLGGGQSLASTASGINNAGAVFNAGGTLLSAGASLSSLVGANLVGATGGDALGALIASNATNWGVSAAGTGGMASLLGSASAAVPYLAAAAAAVSVLKSLDHKRTPHSGASIVTDSLGASANDQGAFFGSTSGAYRWDMNSEVETALKGVNASIVSSLNGISKAFGTGGGYSVGSAFASDNDDASWGTLKLMREGQMVGGFIDQRNFDSSPSKGFEQYSAQASVSVKAAIEAMDLPGWADAMLAKLGESPDFDKLATGVDQIIKTKAALESLGQVFPPLRGLTDTAVSGLLDAFGGVEQLAAASSDYYQQFYSDAERQALTTQQLTESLGKLGLALPATRDQYRALVEAQDLNTEAGRKAYAALLQLAPAFASVTDAAGDMAGGLDEAAKAMVEAGKRALEGLAGDFAKLQVDVLRARGDTAGADQLASKQALDALLAGVSASDAAVIRAQYERNLAIQQEIDQLNAAAAAEKTRTNEQQRIQAQIDQLLGNTAAVRERELAALDPANRALQAYLYSLQDQAAAAQQAAQALSLFQSAMSSLASQRFDVENQILTLQGKDSEVARRTRERDIAEATKNMTAEQAAKYAAEYDALVALKAQAAELQRIQQEAEEQARQQAQAAADAARAAEQLKSAWQNVADSIYGQAARLRGLSSADTPASLAAAQTRFAITTAQARAGDQDAAKLLPELSRTIETLASAQATTLAELERVRAATAASLEQTGALLSQRFGLTIPKLATGTNYVPRDMLAFLHEGEEVKPKAYNPAAGASDTTAAEVRQLRAQVEKLSSLLERTAGATERTRDLLNTATEGGRAMQTEAYT